MKKIIEISPLIAAFLIFNGFLKLYLFYGHWNIKIIDYLDFSEILLSFLNDLNIIVLCLVIFLFHQAFGLKALEFVDNKLKAEVPVVKSTESNPPSNPTPTHGPMFIGLEFLFTQRKWIILLLLLAMTSITAGLFFYTNNRFWLYGSMASLLPLLLIFFDTTPIGESNLSESIAAVLTFLSFTACLAVFDVKEVSKNASNNTITFYTDNETVTTSQTNWLIGKTQNFIFFYDNQTSCTRIIPVDKIKSIEGQKSTNR